MRWRQKPVGAVPGAVGAEPSESRLRARMPRSSPFIGKVKPRLSVQLTTKQHIIPRASIKRFCNSDGRTWVKLRTGEIKHTGPRYKKLVAERAWEERSELKHEEMIEKPFQAIATAVCSGEMKILDQADSDSVSAMFALWVARSRLAEKPLTGLSSEILLGVRFPPDRNVSGWKPEERDELEKKSFVVSDPDGSIPGRMMAWPYMQRQIARICAGLSGIRWGILRAEEGEFLLPDRFRRGCFLPLSPEILLVAGHNDEMLSASGVAKINEIAESDFRKWLISRTEFHPSGDAPTG